MESGDTRTVVQLLAAQGYNIEPAAAKELSAVDNIPDAIDRTIDSLSGNPLIIRTADLPDDLHATGHPDPPTSSETTAEEGTISVSSPHETKGSTQSIAVSNDITGHSTGTGEYRDFVSLFRDRYDRLSNEIRGRVSHRSARSLEAARGGGESGIIGMINDIRSTKNGHWLIELEDTTGTYPILIMRESELAPYVDELVTDEVIGVEGRVSDDGGIIFAESLHFPDIPRTNSPNRADRPVEAALISDVHVGSKEFLEDAWDNFTSWLRTPEAELIEYLVIAGDMVEGVGVYPGQDADLVEVDIYDQYERFSEKLKQVPGDIQIIMIPGNHDAVRLAEPQPMLDDEFMSLFDSHDITATSNPSTITIESVKILVYHGASLDEIIAQVPDAYGTYEKPHLAMQTLLKKRHLAPPFGGMIRIAPEKRDYLVIDEIPDVFHAGHVHTVGVGTYNGITIVNSGCWQSQTDFQQRNNLDPDPGIAPILDLQTLDITLRRFATS